MINKTLVMINCKFFISLLLSISVTSFSNVVRNLEKQDSSTTETFDFMTNGEANRGKICLPSTFGTDKDLPVIYLIDFTEQHFKLATDEFERVIAGVKQIPNFEVIVVLLEDIPDLDAKPESYEKHVRLYKDLVQHVDRNHGTKSERTFMGKGSEGGIVLMTLFLENRNNSIFSNFIVTDPSPLYVSKIIEMIEREDFPGEKPNIKLHISFSTSNNRPLCTKLIDLIDRSKYDWLQFKSIEYTDSNYENTYPISFAAGLKYVYKK